MKYIFSELVDIDKLNMIIERFYNLTGIGATLIDLDGNILSKMGHENGWQDICMKFHRVHPETLKRCIESDTALAIQLSKGNKYVRYKCLNGMVDVAIPVIIEGEHMVNLFSGQWMTEPPDIEFFRNQASRFGFDEKAYLDALSQVKIHSEEHVKKGIELLVLLTEIIAKTALTHMRQTELATENAMIRKEMELARKIQTSLLPINFENIHPDFEISASMVTADKVGGDFYDFTFDRAGYLWFAVGDVSGHGVTPGMIMMMAQTVHTTVTANLECEARDVVVKINEILYKNVHERLKESHFMTFTALKYLGEGCFQYAGAHLSFIVFRQKTRKCELIRTRGVYLNFKRNISKATKNYEFSLESGDVLVLYTDGLTEAKTPDGKMLDIEGFLKIVEKYADRDSENMKDMIMADVLKWSNNVREDDMTLVLIKKREGSE